MTARFIPVIRHLRAEILNERLAPKPMRHFVVTRSFEPSSEAYFADRVVSVSAKIEFRERISEADVQRRTAAGGFPTAEILRRGVCAISKEIYGPVSDELFEILTLLWEDGQHASPAAKRIEALIMELKSGEAGQ